MSSVASKARLNYCYDKILNYISALIPMEGEQKLGYGLGWEFGENYPTSLINSNYSFLP